MEAIIFIGIQASGKSSYYKERYFSSHVRISLDQLRTRYRENLFLNVCLKSQLSFVIDNTNPTRAERVKYIKAAKAANYSITGIYFRSIAEECLIRNSKRAAPVPDIGILSTVKKLERPNMEEGFDNLKYVQMSETGYVIEDWKNAI
ncbi:MAG TPA: kinase [Planctomycetaceae bacterium]|nr:kinase [Planctomycetaceae bacterium]